MTPYRFAFLRIFFGIYLIVFFALMLPQSILPEADYVYWGLLGLSVLFLLGYKRQLVARSLAFFCYLLFVFEKSILHLDSVLTICILLYFAVMGGSEPWRIKSEDTPSKDLKFDLDPRKVTTSLMFEIVLFGGAFIASYIFKFITEPNFNSWTIWAILAFFIALIFPKFIFRPQVKTPAAILFFDGVCGLCSNVVDFVFAEDTQSVFKVAAIQGQTAQEKLPQELRENLNTVVVLSHDGKLYQKSEAILNVLYDLGGFWRLFFVFRLIPRPLSDVFYSLIAKYRYRIFGKKETCRLPSAEEHSKFLS